MLHDCYGVRAFADCRRARARATYVPARRQTSLASAAIRSPCTTERAVALLVLDDELERAQESAQRHLGSSEHPALERLLGDAEEARHRLRAGALLGHQLREHF